MEINIEKWISESGEEYVELRQAIHIILKGISEDEKLSTTMVMKGGTLMGIRYGSQRYTKDVDFSTSQKLKDVDLAQFRAEFNDALDIAAAELGYGITCKVQKCKAEPNEEGTFPTLKMTIGYANSSNQALVKRLDGGKAVNIVNIDYSFNEQSFHKEIIKIDGAEFEAYSIIELVAEKIRAILQQKTRNRNREQDIYDLHFILTNINRFGFSKEEKGLILDTLFKKSEGREIDELLNKDGIRDPEIIKRSAHGYAQLKDDVEELPTFEDAYEVVSEFYESLPWDSKS